jgi:receptor protein-tyrosine kinase
MELYEYLAIVRRQAWLVLLAVGVSVSVAWALSAIQDPTYRASMKIVVGEQGGVLPPISGGSPEPFTQTMSSLLESDIVAQTVIDELDLDLSPDTLLNRLHSTSRPQSAVLDVTYDSTSKESAVRILDAVGAVFPAIVNRRLTTGADGTSERVVVTVFDPAKAEAAPVAPRTLRNVGFAFAVGLLVGLILAFLREGAAQRRRRIALGEKG